MTNLDTQRMPKSFPADTTQPKLSATAPSTDNSVSLHRRRRQPAPATITTSQTNPVFDSCTNLKMYKIVSSQILLLPYCCHCTLFM